MSTHLIPDAATRMEALDPHQSFIIRAPAGSGKTSLLIERMLTLLAHVDDPKSILAITFTRKAADEMNARMEAVLKDPDHPLHLRARNLGWHWKENSCPVTICTIDAWIQSWLPTRYRIHPLPEWLYHEAWLYWLSLGREQTALKQILPLFKGQLKLLGQWLCQALSERASWAFDIGQNAWSDIMETRRAGLYRSWQSELSLHCQDLKDLLIHNAEPQPQALPSIGEDHAWYDLARWLLNQKGAYRTRFEGSMPAAIKKKLIQTTHSWPGHILDLWKYMYHSHTPQDPNLLNAIQSILKELLASLYLVFDRYQSCDFTEQLIQAIQHVQHHSDTVRIEHLLLDEAQDTSPAQIKLISALTAQWRNPHQSIFIVGDPIQSIYRFRDADVRSFLMLSSQGFAHHPLKHLTLSSNFRQSPILTDYINELCAQLMPENILEAGAIAFSPSTAIHDQPGSISRHQHTQDPEEQDRALLKELIQHNPEQSIAVLVRARKHAEHFLNTHDPIHAPDILDALRSSRIRDALELLIFLSDPHDQLSWLYLLRSEWLGASLEECSLYSRRPKKLEDSPKQFQRLMTRPKDSSLRNLWISKMQELGLIQACTRPELEMITKIAQHLECAQNSIGFSGRSYFSALFAQQRLSFADSTQQTHLMTIHKSKGLEFDHVYLPQLDRPERGHPFPPIILTSIFHEHEACSFLWHQTTDGPSWLTHVLRAQAHHEHMRLLYVALTRARFSITMSGSDQGTWGKILLAEDTTK